MKKRMLASVMVLVLGACASAGAAYRTEVTVTPSIESHQYLIEFKVVSVGKDGKAIVLSRPAILTKTGQEGQINVVEKTPDEVRVHCTALIKETDTGVEAVTTVNVMEKGNEVFSTIQSITMQKR